jgi:hypothetical protein
MANKRKKKLRDAAKARRELENLKARGKSHYCDVRNSGIHGSGVYATMDVSKGTQLIEYVGEKIDKEESERRAWAQVAHAEATGDAAVYIFTLSKKWDIDGNVPWNTARLLNHSCDPNCETWVEGKQIFIYAKRDLAKGEELTFDYGFDLDSYEDHPCLCGASNCIGYIVIQESWPELRRLLAEKAAGGSTEEVPEETETVAEAETVAEELVAEGV